MPAETHRARDATRSLEESQRERARQKENRGEDSQMYSSSVKKPRERALPMAGRGNGAERGDDDAGRGDERGGADDAGRAGEGSGPPGRAPGVGHSGSRRGGGGEEGGFGSLIFCEDRWWLDLRTEPERTAGASRQPRRIPTKRDQSTDERWPIPLLTRIGSRQIAKPFRRARDGREPARRVRASVPAFPAHVHAPTASAGLRHPPRGLPGRASPRPNPRWKKSCVRG